MPLPLRVSLKDAQFMRAFDPGSEPTGAVLTQPGRERTKEKPAKKRDFRQTDDEGGGSVCVCGGGGGTETEPYLSLIHN